MKLLPEPATVAPPSPPDLAVMPAPETTRRLNPLEVPGWDALVRSHPEASFFHGTAWAKVLHATYGYRPFYFASFDAQRLLTLLPLMEVNSWLTGRRGVSLPFTDECPLLSSFATTPGDLFEQVMACGKARGWRYWQGRGGLKLLTWAPASVTFFGHTLDLSSGEGRLFANLQSPVRRAIRRGEKEALKVELGQSLEAVQAYYALHCATRRRHGLPPQPFRWFRNLHEQVLAEQMGQVVLAKQGDRPVAGAVFLHLGNKVVYKYAASDPAFQHLRGSNRVVWEAIKWYAREGFRQMDFGRTSRINDGLRRFKLGWGTEEHRIEYVKYDLRKRVFVTESDDANGWHNHVFRRLPLFLSRTIGVCLYRHCA
jgi:hypothetical protein